MESKNNIKRIRLKTDQLIECAKSGISLKDIGLEYDYTTSSYMIINEKKFFISSIKEKTISSQTIFVLPESGTKVVAKKSKKISKKT